MTLSPAAYVQALLREREGYVVKGEDDRVADVDDELNRLGVRAPAQTPETILEAPDLAPFSETTQAAPLPERAVPPKPRRPGR